MSGKYKSDVLKPVSIDLSCLSNINGLTLLWA